jgi:hypothetical protein
MSDQATLHGILNYNKCVEILQLLWGGGVLQAVLFV